MPTWSSPLVGVLQRAIHGMEVRQQVIAGNVANANTPGYKTRRVDFQSYMQAAAGEQQPLQADITHAGQMSFNQTAADQPPVQVDSSTSMRADGNNVDLEKQMVAMVNNQLRYQAVSTGLTRWFQQVKDTISTGGSH